jgi:hypothetical protein
MFKNEELKDYDYLMTWDSLNIKEKIKKYDQEYSHELNLFLYFKDKIFFDQFVKPFLMNKFKKDLID